MQVQQRATNTSRPSNTGPAGYFAVALNVHPDYRHTRDRFVAIGDTFLFNINLESKAPRYTVYATTRAEARRKMKCVLTYYHSCREFVEVPFCDE